MAGGGGKQPIRFELTNPRYLDRSSRKGPGLSVSRYKNIVGLNCGIRDEHGPRLTSAWWLLIVFVDKVAHDTLASPCRTIAA